jgi:uncharacterized protein (DUF1697 family)
MTVWIALLRGINVGGNKQIKMAALKTLLESLDLRGVQTLLQSGNVVFETEQADPDQLNRQIEAGIKETFGFHSAVILRTRKQLRQITEKHPFANDQLAEAGKAVVMFLQNEPDAKNLENLRNSHSGPEEYHLNGQELYLYYTDGMGRSKLTNALIEKKLQTTGTVRNWNTVTKLLALADTLGD